MVLCPFAALIGAGAFGGGSRAAAQVGGEPTAQTDDSVPASHVTMIGASPAEAQDETWGVGEAGDGTVVLVRYVQGSGWSLGPGLLDGGGQPLTGFKLAHPGPNSASPLAGQMTADGSGVLLGTVPDSGTAATREVVLVRNPGGSFKETAPVPSEGEAPLLAPGESLFASGGRAPLLAPLDESDGHAGALIVPVSKAEVEGAVLHWDGSKWASEPIAVPVSSSGEFRVVGIGASSPANAFLLGELTGGEFALFRRVLGGAEGPRWLPVAPAPEFKAGEAISVDPKGSTPGEQFAVPGAPNVLTQILTVTGQGVWIDGQRTDTRVSTTLFYKPAGDSGPAALEAQSIDSWCPTAGGGSPCQHELPEGLPLGTMRSIAWANPSTQFGERVISGSANGVSLRLEGSEFKRVLALGAATVPNDVGGTYGAAFSDPREGWLGQATLPVHLTLQPQPSRLTPWPVSFRHTLLAVAPQPGAPVGGLSSEALAVGDRGEVARYKPGQGWLPESLTGAGGRHAEPVLRSVAWPSPSRAFAVGNEGEMWLWRGETGLWEKDPATPFNFRGNLLSVAFDSNNPDRGYAVGQGGVLLSYGKSWSQDTLPPEAAGANFTSVAFAGSEAIAAYRILPDPSRNRYVGGLLVNDGSGWHVDAQAAAVVGANVPEVVAGLPDGGAAFAASGTEPADVFERGGPGEPWQRTSTPLPGNREPGSLALFREGQALRVIASGTALNTYAVESETPAPNGSPPILIKPYPLEASAESGVLRQTATGWSDEEHELNNALEAGGNYHAWDTPYQPDPISAVLIDPSGTQGWAVGGFVETEHGGVLDTADIDRYPADGVSPPGVGTSAIPTDSSVATFAIGGGAQCAAPCADRANSLLGPDLWLTSALARSEQIAGVRAFLYTGPRVTTGQTDGPATLAIPYGRELGRYAQLLVADPSAFAAISPSEVAGGEGEGLFEQAFASAPAPFGGGAPAAEMTPAGGAREEECTAGPGCQAYYAMDSKLGSGATVRVIVLDDSSSVGEAQRSWLAAKLREAGARKEPAIVVGNANLNAQIAAGDPSATAVASIILGLSGENSGSAASAYFYDAPEQNRTETLRIGSESIPVFGSGTLGYVNFVNESSGQFIGASGFLLAEAHVSEPLGHNRVRVTARLIPNVGELALEAQEGTLLRRSQAAKFSGLARRARAGNRALKAHDLGETDPYIPIPSTCVGVACSQGLLPEYTFSSSNPRIGRFVKQNFASSGPPTVLQNSRGEPIADEYAPGQAHEPQAGLFCAFNPGTTIVTISAGGLSSSLPVTVQAGSVRQPCGTVPREEALAQQSGQIAPPSPAPAPTPAGPAPASSPPPVPLPPPPAAIVPPAPARPPAAKPFFLPPALGSPVLAFVPPPVPTPARPTPPSGTSAVTSPVEAAEKEEEQEEATEKVSNQAVAYDRSEHELAPAYIIGIMVLAAFAGVSIRRRPGRGRREVRVASATVSGARSQERAGHVPRSRR